MKDSAFLQGVHHAYAQTDGAYAWPNSREGDLLREAKREIDRLINALHQISLCSANSASSKEECGRIARAALVPNDQGKGPGFQPGPAQRRRRGVNLTALLGG